MGQEWLRPRRLISGALGEAGRMHDYRAVWLGDILVERATWGAGESQHLDSILVADEGFVWVRFWLPADEAVVVRVFDAAQRPVGTWVEVTMPLLRTPEGFETLGLVLSIWIDPKQGVTLFGENEFETAVRNQVLSVGEAKRAEHHIRDLTTKIARGAFPPPLARNFQLEPTRQVDHDNHRHR